MMISLLRRRKIVIRPSCSCSSSKETEPESMSMRCQFSVTIRMRCYKVACTHSNALQSGWDVRSTRADSLMTASCSGRLGNNGTVPELVPCLAWFVCLQDLLRYPITYLLKFHCWYTPSNCMRSRIKIQLNFNWCCVIDPCYICYTVNRMFSIFFCWYSVVDILLLIFCCWCSVVDILLLVFCCWYSVVDMHVETGYNFHRTNTLPNYTKSYEILLLIYP
jgi:hypothetical protein